jgi:hypothetical protein
MKKLIAIALVLALTACSSGLEPLNHEEQTRRDRATEAPVTVATEAEIPVTTAPAPEPREITFLPETGDIMWIVPPTFDYESIILCVCNVFRVAELTYDEEFPEWGEFWEMGDIINEVTGQIDRPYDNGHGGGFIRYLYDPALKLFGYHMADAGHSEIELFPIDDVPELFGGNMNIIVVYSVDTTQVTVEEHDWGIDYLLPKEAYHGEIALAFGGEFITDFIFDDLGQGRFFDRDWENQINLQSMSKNGKFGVMNEKGEEVVPFIFEDVLTICEDTAFAKWNGKYGIISITGQIPEPPPIVHGDSFR